MASADLVAFPSTTDTLGLAALEAMASGLPVLVADSDNGRDLVSGTRAVAIFDPDRPQSLLRALEQVLAERPTPLELVKFARRRFPSWSQATDRLLSLYDAAVATRELAG